MKELEKLRKNYNILWIMARPMIMEAQCEGSLTAFIARNTVVSGGPRTPPKLTGRHLSSEVLVTAVRRVAMVKPRQLLCQDLRVFLITSHRG